MVFTDAKTKLTDTTDFISLPYLFIPVTVSKRRVLYVHTKQSLEIMK